MRLKIYWYEYKQKNPEFYSILKKTGVIFCIDLIESQSVILDLNKNNNTRSEIFRTGCW